MKYLSALFMLSCLAFISATNTSVHQFMVESIDGGNIDFSKFKGKKILIVNTASKCGFTDQYIGLEALFQQHKGKLVIVGFPANDFKGQEPGTNAEILKFCTSQFKVSFPMAAKVSVKGSQIHPLFDWLTNRKKNGVMDANISWNFNKFLLDEKGKLLQHFASDVTPTSDAITQYLK